ncbi:MULTISPECIES: glycosyltransferase [unclassified Microbacterium]|uniref:glycosyltransferase n=1 Tax=unclassified Microbacterium TaxID=2609290 RepID=UPI00301975A0
MSIVIPVFDDEETVAAALASCLAQTMTDVEVIVVDDASTDRTAEIIEGFCARDPRVRLIRQPQNLSAFQARRAGIFGARGEYVLFVDGDDELLPHAAETSVAAAQRHQADLVGFAIEVINQDGAVVGGYQNRLNPKHASLTGGQVLEGLFPLDKPAQGQLWRYLFRTEILRAAYDLVPEDLVLPRVNDLPLLYLVAALAQKYVSIKERLYRYYYGRGGSGQLVDTIEQAEFYAEAIRSVDSIAPAVESIARTTADPSKILDSYESVRLSIIGYVCSYLLKHTRSDLREQVLEHLDTCASATDLVVAATRFYPDSLVALKHHSKPVGLDADRTRSVLLTTRILTTGGVSSVLLAQADYLMRAGYQVTIVARRYGSDPSIVPPGATFIEMVGRGLPERLMEWAEICRAQAIDVIIDHQVLYSKDWPEYALVARGVGVATIAWLHNFAARPIYDLNGLHAVLKENAPLLEMIITLSPLDVSFWKLRGAEHSAFVPNPPSPMLIESAGVVEPKALTDGPLRLVWWGRFDEHTKQVSQLIEVADELRKLSVDFSLTVIGPGWGEWTPDRFNALAQSRGLAGKVRAIGERRGAQLIAAIDDADAFVSTSVIEGYQLTIAEAQSRGLPVFMYDLPWLTVVQDNEGVVTSAQGDAASLAEQIATVAESPERYGELSRAAIDGAARALSYDFARLYEQVVTGTLPAEFSPEPTMADAQQLLDLTIFYAERNAGTRTAVAGARREARRATKGKPSTVGAPQGASLGHRAWRAATPLGKTVLQLAPGLRPIAHRVKVRLVRRR